MEPLQINITPALNGFIVQCGCQKVVFTDLTTMVNEIFRYYKDPSKVRGEYISKAVNAIIPSDQGATVRERGPLAPPPTAQENAELRR
jgi:hypothetical protein